MRFQNPPVIFATAVLALALIFAAGAVQAAVKVRAANNGDVIVDISDKRGIASYWIFARNFRGPILGVNVGVRAWWLFRCPKSTSVTLKLPPRLIGQAIVVKYLPCGGIVPEDYIASSITTTAADASPLVYKDITREDEDGTSYRVLNYEGGFVVLKENGDGTYALERNLPLPTAMDIEPIDLKRLNTEGQGPQ